jgi:hypothetical protein
MVDIDLIRMDRISDPKFVFSYSIRADGKVILKEPASAVLNNLRSAIDYARCTVGEAPFCIKCKKALSEADTFMSDANRFCCPNCQTIFNWK